MIRVVMMTLVRWDDHGGVINQAEADQDVADEVSEEVDYCQVTAYLTDVTVPLLKHMNNGHISYLYLILAIIKQYGT